METVQTVDTVIVGGGIAGLWLLNLLDASGYDAVLFEADAIGCGQTLASQGMIHGGLKYALGGALTGASEAIAAMPGRWRACLLGSGPVDLTGLTPLSERYYLFAQGGSLGSLTGFFASRMLRGRIEKLAAPDYPVGLSGFDGVVYALNDFVLDTPALLRRLAGPVTGRIYHRRIDAPDLERTDRGWAVSLDGTRLEAARLVLSAGVGNAALLGALPTAGPGMQRRPLHQVLVRHPDLKPLFAHCLTGITRPEPRLTITSHPEPEADGRWLWYLGGQLASTGVARDAAAQITHARQELSRCVPWLDWSRGMFSCLQVDRAEPEQPGLLRPDEAFVEERDDCLVCWPTKLSLTPDLGDKVLARLPPPGGSGAGEGLMLPRAQPGSPPWGTGSAGG